jgi:hypothetical protein
MKKTVLILLCALLGRVVFSQGVCEKPVLPEWDKKVYKYSGDYIMSPEISLFVSGWKEYLACERKRKKSDTLALQTKLTFSLDEIRKEVKWDSINLRNITTEDVIKWGKKNLFESIELQFGGFMSRPKDFADLTIPDDYVYSFGIKKKASDQCVTCPQNLFGRDDEELKKDESKDSYAFNKQGMEYRITWNWIRNDGREYSESRQYARYTKIFSRYGFWFEADHKNRVNALVEDYGSNQEFAKGGLRLMYRVNQNVNLTAGYNVRATPWAAYTNEFISFYENSYWDTESAAQNVFYDFNGNSEWENDELVGTYTEILDPALNEPYITNEFNAKKRIWAWTGSPVVGIDVFNESSIYFFNAWMNFYPKQEDLVSPSVKIITSGNGIDQKAFGMEADWAPTDNVFEYDGGIEAGLKLGKKFSFAISGEISNYYGVQDYRTTFGIKYKL